MKTDLVLTIALFCIMIGIGLGMTWRYFQVEPVYKARIEWLEQERRDLKLLLADMRTQAYLAEKGKPKRK